MECFHIDMYNWQHKKRTKQDVIKINLIQIRMNEVNVWIQPKAMTFCWRVSLFIIWLYCCICYLQWEVHVKLFTSDISLFLFLSVLCGKNFTRISQVQNHTWTLRYVLLTKIVLSSFVHAGPKNITNPVWCLQSGGISVRNSQTLPKLDCKPEHLWRTSKIT